MFGKTNPLNPLVVPLQILGGMVRFQVLLVIIFNLGARHPGNSSCGKTEQYEGNSRGRTSTAGGFTIALTGIQHITKQPRRTFR